MKKGIFSILSNDPIAPGVFRMTLSGDTGAITAPGQFINIALAGHYLRRPISVCDWEVGSVTVVYKVVGQGTRELSAMCPGEMLDMLTGLGNGYDTSLSGDRPLLIGGGAGVPPMFALCRALISQDKRPIVILGFNTASEIFMAQDFAALGADVTVATADGSAGVRGFVTDAMPDNYTYFYACGPEPMLKAVSMRSATSGQFSFEERMGCGFGACMGCSCQTKYGAKRICRDGPVLIKEEVIW